MNYIGTYDGTIFYNPANKFCIVSVKTADQSVPAEARSNRRYKDHLIRFTAVGYEIPRTDAVELELDGEWTKGKYGVQLQVEQWREIVPRTKNGVEGYLASGLIKGIGPKTAADIVERFGVDTLDILEHQPERLLEIRGITESKLEDIKASYAENRMLQGIMTLLAPFKITPKTALKIYQYFGPTSVEILEKSPFELCQISGFGFRRVDAIVQKSGGNLHDSMRIKGAVFCALDEGKSKRGHLYISSEELEKSALKLLNEKIPVPELRLHQQEVRDMMQEMILNGAVVSVKDNIYLPRVFAQEDETARRIAQRLVAQMPVEHIAPVLEQVKVEMGLRLSAQQEAAVYAAFRHGLSVITGSPGTGKTTVLRTILEVYRRLHPDGKIALMAPTGRASRRMSESTGFEDARTLHSGLGLTSEEDEGSRNRKSEPLSADLIIVDEFSMVDMWLAEKFFERMKINARIVLVGDPDQLPSVGAGNVFREIIETKIVPVTVLDQIFRQSKDSLIAYNAKFINEGNTKLFYGPDFVFVSGDSQEDTAEKITERYCLEIQESGIENVQILSPFRSEGAASSEQLNETIRELVNPFRSAEEEIKFGPKIFRINDRIMQTKNTEKVSNGDLGFIRYIKDTDQGKKIGMDFGAGRTLEYGVDDLSNVDLAYAIPATEFCAPKSIDFTHGHHICIDGLYYAYLLVPSDGYKTQVPAGWLSLIVNAGDGIDMDMFLSRQPKETIIQKVGQQLRINRSKIKDASDTNTDFDDIDGAIRSGYFLKEGLANNEDFYYLNLLITITASNEEDLEWKVSEMKKLLLSQDMNACTCHFREEQAFLSALPLVAMEKKLYERGKRNLLTGGAASCYPFTSYEMCDDNGILLGVNKYNSSLIIVDIFNSAVYKNANMSILGTSGAGKTFTMQLMALRMRRKNIPIFIVAPLKGHEFHRACSNVGGSFIQISPASPHCINVMEIRRVDRSVNELLDGPGIQLSELAAKIQQLHIFFSLLIPDMSHEERQLLDEALVRTYNTKGITHDNASLEDPAQPGQYREMPVLGDLYEILKTSKETMRVAHILNRLVNGSASTFNKQTNVRLDNKYTVLDISSLTGDLLTVGMFVALDFVWDRAKADRTEEKAIFIDECWQLLSGAGAAGVRLAGDFLLEIAKTIRGYGGASIFASQDLADFFDLDGGRFGKGIINNSKTKIILNLEDDEAQRVQEALHLSDAETMEITHFERGHGLISTNNNNIMVEFKASPLEKDLITTDRRELREIVERKRREQSTSAEQQI